ncbi:hypothetical protein [Sphingomonas sp. KC8]|uniref:hypothetical protein n=1 Tax=Sphingomonas sp. KC8 TaxID=1030157 RepID=UPI000681EC64|nr:hypothetical protein [Sphingomonas sp. KC8]ARS27558.1 hypothetical protein KC8_09665 [Sphingomonas sp. KC8]
MTVFIPALRGISHSSLLIGALLLAAPALAAEPDTAQIIRLTPEQKAAALEGGSEAKADAALNRAAGGGADRAIDGEVGAMIGTGGARGVFGTAAIPLGDNAGAIISFENSRYGNRR